MATNSEAVPGGSAPGEGIEGRGVLLIGVITLAGLGSAVT
jgi:hypothetical protein